MKTHTRLSPPIHFVAPLAIVAVLATLALAVILLRSAAAAPGDAVSDRVFGQGGSFTSGIGNLGGISASSLSLPWGVVADGTGNLYVSEFGNNRVVEYNSPLTTDTVADRVFGQGGSFTSGTCNLGGISASSLCVPSMMAVDGSGNLYVADTSNHRVLEYDSPLGTDTVADRVFGQGGSFTSGICNLGGISASSLCNPYSVAVDGAGNLYATDAGNNRVLEYNTPLTTDTVADRVFGQGGSFTSGACVPPSASSLCGSDGVAVRGVGNLYVADTSNQRVLEYDSPLTTDTVADQVFGQPDFTTVGVACVPPSASSLCYPNGVAVDGAGNLYVVDHQNDRVLEYHSPIATDQVPDRVVGQPGFTTGDGACVPPSDSSLCRPLAAAVDSAGNLYVTDHNNHRVLEYDGCPNGTPPWPVPTGDDDCDGFTTAIENFVGTDPLVKCAATSTANDEPPPDKWPVDFNNDQKATLSDVLKYSPVFNTTDPGLPYLVRFDLNGDNHISLSDVLKFSPFFNKSCSP